MAVAFPFIQVQIDASALTPVAERAPGVIAVVGQSDAGNVAANTPTTVDNAADVDAKFGANTRLATSLKLALLQSPGPSRVYGVKAAGNPPSADDYRAALASLEARDDVTFVSLANEAVDIDAADPNAATALLVPLKEHVDNMLTNGQKRIAVSMINPPAKTAGDKDRMLAQPVNLRSDNSRTVLVVARGAVMPGTTDRADVATAAMAAIAGFSPHISIVLKRIRGFSMPAAGQFGPGEIRDLSDAGLVPIIDPSLIVGEGLHFAEGKVYTNDLATGYIDIVRVLDDIDFRLKAGLIGAIGDARITKSGLTAVKTRTEGVLGPLQRNAVIDGFNVSIPVLDVLFMPEAARTATDTALVTTARSNRTVEMTVEIIYGAIAHLLLVRLVPKF
jgi:hypothetical protein